METSTVAAIDSSACSRTRDLGVVAGEYLELIMDPLALVSRLARIPEYNRRFETAMNGGDFVAIQKLAMEAGLVHQVSVLELSARKITVTFHHKACHSVTVTIEK